MILSNILIASLIPLLGMLFLIPGIILQRFNYSLITKGIKANAKIIDWELQYIYKKYGDPEPNYLPVFQFTTKKGTEITVTSPEGYLEKKNVTSAKIVYINIDGKYEAVFEEYVRSYNAWMPNAVMLWGLGTIIIGVILAIMVFLK